MSKPTEMETNIKIMRELKRVQGEDGSWNYDSYNCGLYNGIEMSLSLLEDREPDFKTLRGKKAIRMEVNYKFNIQQKVKTVHGDIGIIEMAGVNDEEKESYLIKIGVEKVWLPVDEIYPLVEDQGLMMQNREIYLKG